MHLFLEATSERGKATTKSANEYLCMDLTVNRKPIGQVELYYYNDTKSPKMTADEWILKYRTGDSEHDNDWQIIAQGDTKVTKGIKSQYCPHYINSNPKYNPDGWKFCSQC